MAWATASVQTNYIPGAKDYADGDRLFVHRELIFQITFGNFIL